MSENVKKIRELADFNVNEEISRDDLLIVATGPDTRRDSEGDADPISPQTVKATIEAIITAYNKSLIPPSGGGSTTDPSDRPNAEFPKPGGGTYFQDTTPFTAANLELMIGSGCGLTVTDVCHDESEALVADCSPLANVKYKTKKLCLNLGANSDLEFDTNGDLKIKESSSAAAGGYQGQDLDFIYGFPKSLRQYSSGKLISVSNDIGKILEHCLPMVSNGSFLSKWFVGVSGPMSPKFGLQFWANSSAEQNFDQDSTGSWIFTPGWGFVYINIASMGLNEDFVQDFWLWDDHLGWVWFAMDIYPFVWVNADLFSTGSPTGWVYGNSDGAIPAHLTESVYFVSQGQWLKKSDQSAPATPPTTTPPATPTRAITELAPELNVVPPK